MTKIIFHANIMRALYKNNNMGTGNDVPKPVKGING